MWRTAPLEIFSLKNKRYTAAGAVRLEVHTARPLITLAPRCDRSRVEPAAPISVSAGTNINQPGTTNLLALSRCRGIEGEHDVGSLNGYG